MSAGSGQPPAVERIAHIWRSACTPDGFAEYDFRFRAERSCEIGAENRLGFTTHVFVFLANCEDFCRVDVR
jgi:hypothetical protein